MNARQCPSSCTSATFATDLWWCRISHRLIPIHVQVCNHDRIRCLTAHIPLYILPTTAFETFEMGHAGIVSDCCVLYPNAVKVIWKHSGDRWILFNCQHQRGGLILSLASQLLQIEAAAPKSPGMHYTSILIHHCVVFKFQTVPIILHLRHC